MTKYQYRNKYLKSPRWLRFARRVRTSRNYTCRDCLNPGYDVHHLHYRTLGRERPEDVVLLCRVCHHARHYPPPPPSTVSNFDVWADCDRIDRRDHDARPRLAPKEIEKNINELLT